MEIRGKSVSFINPSLRDYLIDYLDDIQMLRELAELAPKAGWARELWRHVSATRKFSEADKETIALAFVDLASNFMHLNMHQRSSREPRYFRYSDISNSDRIELLLEWYEATGVITFLKVARAIAEKPANGFISWKDGLGLIRITAKIARSTKYDDGDGQHLKTALENATIDMLLGYVWPDDLEQICQEIINNEKVLDEGVLEAANEAIVRNVNDIDSVISDVDSESVLADQISVLRRLAPRAGVTSQALKNAIAKIEVRISDITSTVETATAPSVAAISDVEEDSFDDEALADLFAPLMEKQRQGSYLTASPRCQPANA